MSQTNNPDKSQKKSDQSKEDVIKSLSSGKANQPEKSPSNGGSFLAVLALLLSLVALGAGYYLWNTYIQPLTSENQQLSQQLTALERKNADVNQALGQTAGALVSVEDKVSQLEQLKQAVADVEESVAAQNALVERQDALSKKQDEFVAVQKASDKAIDAINQLVSRDGNDWLLLETQYLLQLANHRLNLADDASTAINALEIADSRLLQLNDPGFVKVRDAIAQEVTQLKGVAEPDITGLVLRLEHLSEQVSELTVAGPKMVAPKIAGIERPSASDEPFDWNALLTSPFWTKLGGDAWTGFKSLMVIHNTSEPVMPLVSPKERLFLFENIKLELNIARNALLTGDTQLVTRSLNQVLQWLAQNFVAESAKTQGMIESIEAVRDTDISRDLPDISGSLRQLREALVATKQGE